MILSSLNYILVNVCCYRLIYYDLQYNKQDTSTSKMEVFMLRYNQMGKRMRALNVSYKSWGSVSKNNY